MAASIPKLKCQQCAYEWYPRSERIPKACPDCQSRNWMITKNFGRRKEDKLAVTTERT